MSLPFTATLRAPGAPLELGSASQQRIVFRVQVAEAWDAVRVTAPLDVSVDEVVRQAVGQIAPGVAPAEDYLVKLHGVEVADRLATLSDAGVQAGSTLLVANRRRRPVR